MKILKAFKDVALFPVRALKQVKDDLTSNDETDIALTMFTLGTFSILKTVGKTIDKVSDDLEDWSDL
ncbi:MAG: hypothetical protein J5781_00175 [Clostridia bacterium]|nr:hypothetical protein [Clostridia bacterium]